MASHPTLRVSPRHRSRLSPLSTRFQGKPLQATPQQRPSSFLNPKPF